MWDIFDQPWTLLIVAILVLLGLMTLGSIFPEKRHWWQLALPGFLFVAAFGLDFLVETDLEKIKKVIDIGIKAVEQENCSAIEQIISADYSDSYHNTKNDLMSHCREVLLESLIKKNKRRPAIIEISLPQATVTLTVITHFDEQSYVYREFGKPFIITKIKLYLRKEQNKGWVINRAEILEIDRQPVNWKDIR